MLMRRLTKLRSCCVIVSLVGVPDCQIFYPAQASEEAEISRKDKEKDKIVRELIESKDVETRSKKNGELLEKQIERLNETEAQLDAIIEELQKEEEESSGTTVE